MWSNEEFAGVRCLVTGASGGIGFAVCEAFAAAGAYVTALDVRESELQTEPWRKFISCDITSEEGLRRLGETVAENRGLDVLVNAAGIMDKSPLGEIDWVGWDRVYAVNCRSPLRILEKMLGHLKASKRGRVINIASMTASLGLPTYAPYSSSKAALLNASRVAGAELASSGITVNTISPGWVATPMIQPLFTRMEALHGLPVGGGRAYIEALIPQGRLVEPQEVAAAVLFLSSRAGGAVTGHDLAIDGGLTTIFTPGVHLV